MASGFYNVPKAVNEPINSYAPGTPERKALLDTYKKMFNEQVEQVVLDMNGEVVPNLLAEKIDLSVEKKKAEADRLLPLFVFKNEKEKFYILSVRGSGLWDEIWGYVALQTDLSTIEGVTFSHKGETPGLGARITSPDVQQRFQGKQIFDESGNLQSVAMQKGEGKDYSSDTHKVDGLSGATITANGVNNMLKNYLQYYSSFLSSQKSGNQTEVVAEN